MKLRNDNLKFETLKKSHKKQIVIGAVLICLIGGVLTFRTTRAKYKLTQTVNIVDGVVNYKVPDLRIVAVNVSEDGENYEIQDDVPASGYTLNSEKSVCRVYDGTTSVAEAPIDRNITITYHDGLVGIDNLGKRNTRCYLYFDMIADTEKPVITNVKLETTDTEIKVIVEATDNVGIAEYYYSIDEGEYIKETTNIHVFEITDTSIHIIKVYVKDARGNTSEVYTKKTAGTSEDTLAKLNITNYKEQTDTVPDFSQETTTDEGVFKVEDGMYGGYSYYWRGAVTNNHVIFANKCWRIVRINGDGSIRLIYNGGVLTGENKCKGNESNYENRAVTNVNYNIDRYKSSYAGWTYKESYQRPSATTEEGVEENDSNAKMQTEYWFSTNITGINLDKVADGKFCNDRNVGEGTWSVQGRDFRYSAYTRLYNASPTPTLSCPEGDVYTLKVGLITADEVVYAGSGKSYYLYNGGKYWTISPADFSYSSSYKVYVFIVDLNGFLNYSPVNDTSNRIDIRPVLNLKPDTTFVSGGTGTTSSPYEVYD